MLVDTSVWIDHFRRHSGRLAELLENAQVLVHPFVIGELACGNSSRRAEVLELIAALPGVPLVSDEEVLDFVAIHRLKGRGLGWIDVHLLASARMAHTPSWTLDRRLALAAAQLSLQPIKAR